MKHIIHIILELLSSVSVGLVDQVSVVRLGAPPLKDTPGLLDGEDAAVAPRLPSHVLPGLLRHLDAPLHRLGVRGPRWNRHRLVQELREQII